MPNTYTDRSIKSTSLFIGEGVDREALLAREKERAQRGIIPRYLMSPEDAVKGLVPGYLKIIKRVKADENY